MIETEGSTSVRRTTITRLPDYQTTQLSNYLPKQPPQPFPPVFCIIFFAGLKPLAQYVEALQADERVGFQPTFIY